jgi:copper(I)-binding protein
VTRWNRRLLFGAMAVLVPVLAGCEAGLNAPTLQFHPASAGVSTIVDGITIDNAFVLGPTPGSALPAGGQAGAFLALTTPNNDRLVSVSAPGTATSVTVAGGSVDLPSSQLVDLDGPAPQIVLTGLTNPLSGGESVQLVLTFATAGSISVDVPVEPNAYDFATYSQPPTPTPTPTPTASVKPRATKPRATRSASPSASASASPSTTG